MEIVVRRRSPLWGGGKVESPLLDARGSGRYPGAPCLLVPGLGSGRGVQRQLVGATQLSDSEWVGPDGPRGFIHSGCPCRRLAGNVEGSWLMLTPVGTASAFLMF